MWAARQLFSVTVFLAAALLFALQPMVGKMLLPLAGGAVGAWLSVLLFFQFALLAGYALVHVLARYGAWRQGLYVLLALAVGAALLPVQLDATTPLLSPLQIGLQLALAVGLPFVALAMLSGTVQRLYALYFEREPYHLYALSNAGSLVGLLCYPFLIEPHLTLGQQAWGWALAYGALLLLVGLLLHTTREVRIFVPSNTSWPARPQLYKWALLAAVPASLSYGMTMLVTVSFGSFPLFWVGMLALYLLSYVLAYMRASWVDAIARLNAQWFLVAALALNIMGPTGQAKDVAQLALLLISFFLLALACHRQLAQQRPAASQLTLYYVCIAVGGAAGGLFNTLLVPLLPLYPAEYMVVALAAAFVLPVPRSPAFLAQHARLWTGALVLALLAVLVASSGSTLGFKLLGAAALALVLVVTSLPRHFAAVALVFLGTALLLVPAMNDMRIYRNFFGVAIILEQPAAGGRVLRYISTGSGLQGAQQVQPYVSTTPGLYFEPISSLMQLRPFNRIGMVGVGAGMALCYTAPQRQFTVYEIDPKFVTIANSEFSFIQHCGTPEWRMGDGRLLLQADAHRQYDLLMLDAFQDVNIPLHLLTVEALQLYRNRLAPNGLILYNLNSLYYDLYPQIAAQARAAGLQVWRASSSWLLVADSAQDLSALHNMGWVRYQPSGAPLWHDNYSDILSVLRFMP